MPTTKKEETKKEVQQEHIVVPAVKNMAPEPKAEAKAEESSPIRVEENNKVEEKRPEPEEDKEEENKEEEKKQDGEHQEVQESAAMAFGTSENLKTLLDSIKQKFEETGQMYEDQDFPATDSSLYKDPTNPPDYAKDCPIIDWKRPHEIVPVSPAKSHNPCRTRSSSSKALHLATSCREFSAIAGSWGRSAVWRPGASCWAT